MRIIKLGIISFIFFFLLITGFSLFIPSKVRISRARNTGVVKDSLFEKYVRDLNQWKNWYPGFNSLNLKPTIFLNTRTVSASSGDMHISLKTEGDSIVHVVYEKPGKKPINEVFRKILHPLQDSVTIHWYMDFRLRWYPWEKFSGLTFEKRYGTRMEEGLTRLASMTGK